MGIFPRSESFSLCARDGHARYVCSRLALYAKSIAPIQSIIYASEQHVGCPRLWMSLPREPLAPSSKRSLARPCRWPLPHNKGPPKTEGLVGLLRVPTYPGCFFE